jgi:hypothetical protein
MKNPLCAASSALVVGAALSVVGLSGCGKDDGVVSVVGSETTLVAFRDVPNYGGFKITRVGTFVIRSQETWMEYWDKYWRYGGPGGKSPPPYVDFQKYNVVGLAWGGERGFQSCYWEVPAIESVFTVNDTLFVGATYVPEPEPKVCAVQVWPLHMIQVPKSGLPVKFFGIWIRFIES